MRDGRLASLILKNELLHTFKMLFVKCRFLKEKEINISPVLHVEPKSLWCFITREPGLQT